MNSSEKDTSTLEAPQSKEAVSSLSSPTAARETNFLRMFSFSSYMTVAMIASFLPLYFLDEGYSESQIGILYSIGPFISIFANLLLGIISDKYRTIKRLLIILLIGQLIMVSLLYTTDSFIVVCFIMLAFYFFQTPVNPLSDSLILLSSQYTGTPYALVRIFGSLGFAFSALAGGFLLKETGSSATPIISLICIGIALIFTFTLKDYQGSLRKMDFSGFYKLLRKPAIVSFFALVLVISIAHRMYEGFLGITLRHMGASDSFIGIAWLTSAISEIPIVYLLGKYGHKFKELPLMAIASFMYAVRMLLMSQISSPIWAIPIQAMHSVTFGIYFITALRYISSIIPDEYRASGQAVYAVVFVGFSGIISGLAGGSIFEHFGKETFFQLAMILSLLASGGFLAKHFFSRSSG